MMTLRSLALSAAAVIAPTGTIMSVAVALLLASSTTSCGGGDAASPAASCSSASWNVVGTLQTPRIDFDLPCSSANVTYVDTVNQFGGVTAYDYNIRCTDGSNQHSGRVSDIQYASTGSPTSATFTHNGQSCGTVTSF